MSYTSAISSATQVHSTRQRTHSGAKLHFYLACRFQRSVTSCSPLPLTSFGVLFTSHTSLSLSWCFCQLEPGGHQSSRFVPSLSVLRFSLQQYPTYYFRQGDTQTRMEAETAVKVMTGNLVRPWSWVTWQVHAGIRLTRKPLSKTSRVNERSWAGRGTQRWKRETKQTVNTVLQRKLFERLVCFQDFDVVGMYVDRTTPLETSFGLYYI